VSRYVEVIVLTEGKTELLFVKRILAPYLGKRQVYMIPIQLSKPGENGGDVRFARARNDIARHLKQRKDTYISLLVDYYGIGRDWPGLEAVPHGASPDQIARVICTATQKAIDTELSDYRSGERFLPHISVHEFEALLFSAPEVLAMAIDVDRQLIDAILREHGEPEAIDRSPEMAPAKRIRKLCNRFKKTGSGIDIAKAIGIERMRLECPLFNAWLERLEKLVGNGQWSPPQPRPIKT